MSTSIPATIKALELTSYDGPPSLRVVEKATPTPGPGEVLIKVHASPVNPSDLLFTRGQYGIRRPLPTVCGFEGSGLVVAAGAGWRARYLRGKNVSFGAGEGDGCWAEYAVVSAFQCISVPARLPLDQAAMALVNPMTAIALLSMARVGRHPAIIQTAAASTLGRMIVRLSKQKSLPAIHIVRRAEQVAELRALGAEFILNSEEPGFEADLAALARRLGATLALDAVAGPLAGQVLHAMPRGSEIVIYGLLSAADCQFLPGDFVFDDKRARGFWLSAWLGQRTLLESVQLARRVHALLSTDLRSAIRARVPLDEAIPAISAYEANMSGGKLLIMP